MNELHSEGKSITGQYMEKFKSFITEDEIAIEGKGETMRSEPFYAKFLISTNNIDSIKLESGQRRFSIARVSAAYMGDKARWDRFNAGLLDAAELDKFFTYLATKDISAFDPFQIIAQDKTDDTDVMMQSKCASLKPIVRFMLNFLAPLPAGYSDSVLKESLFSSYVAYCEANRYSASKDSQFGKDLVSMGVRAMRFNMNVKKYVLNAKEIRTHIQAMLGTSLDLNDIPCLHF